MSETTEKAIAVAEKTAQSDLAFVPSQENVELLKKTLAGQEVNLSDAELQLLIYQSTKTGLDPLARQIYALKGKKDNDRMTFMVSIDGQRLVAQRTGQYRGQTSTLWCGADGVWKDAWLEDEPPKAAKVGVRRAGFDEPLYAIATYKSYAKIKDKWVNGKPSGEKYVTGTWAQMPDVMLAKCAEALALRKAFPQELSGLYTAEEMDNAAPAEVIDHETGEVTPNPKADPRSKTPEKTTKEVFSEIAVMLTKRGFNKKSDQRLIFEGFTDTKDLPKLNLGELKEIQKAMNDASDDQIKAFLPTEGEVVDKKSDAEEIPA